MERPVKAGKQQSTIETGMMEEITRLYEKGLRESFWDVSRPLKNKEENVKQDQ